MTPNKLVLLTLNFNCDIAPASSLFASLLRVELVRNNTSTYKFYKFPAPYVMLTHIEQFIPTTSSETFSINLALCEDEQNFSDDNFILSAPYYCYKTLTLVQY